MPVIELKDITVSIRGHEVVNDVSLSFSPGEIHALLGPNGAGKSTLFKSVLGAVSCHGETSPDPHSLRIGHLIEYPAFYAKLSLRDNLRLHASYLRVDDEEVGRLMSLVGLDERSATLFAAASLGMRQRLGIARALLGRPQLLLLDEPTNGLDPLGIRWCRQLLCRIRDELGAAIVVASHHLAEVSAVADRVTFLRRGTVIFETSHRGPFTVTPTGEDDPHAIVTAAGPHTISPCDDSAEPALPASDLEDVYTLLMEDEIL